MKKKSLAITAIIATTCLFFTACDNSSRSMAKNLEDSVTNLIYTVSSLDWVNSESLTNLNGELKEDMAYEYTITSKNAIKNNMNSYGDTYRTEQNNEEYESEHNDNLDISLNSVNEGETERLSSIPQNKKLPIRYNKGKRHKRPFDNRSHYLDQAEHELTQEDQVFSADLKQASDLQSNRNITSSELITYSTESIESGNNQIQETITNLISKRSTLLLYINDLYKGNIKLTNEDSSALNAYINIIKENTAFLNQNKGIITNQISQANSIGSSNENSPLINAYLIRTNEAISTRIAKLKSSISAIESICEILEQKTTNKIASNQATDLSTERSINNTNKLVTNNKNANTHLNNDNNSNYLTNINTDNEINSYINKGNSIYNTQTNKNEITSGKNGDLLTNDVSQKNASKNANLTTTNNNLEQNTTLNNENYSTNNITNQNLIANDNVLNGLYGNNTSANEPSKNAINTYNSNTTNCNICDNCCNTTEDSINNQTNNESPDSPNPATQQPQIHNLIMSFINPKQAEKYIKRNTTPTGYTIDKHTAIQNTPYVTNVS